MQQNETKAGRGLIAAQRQEGASGVCVGASPGLTDTQGSWQGGSEWVTVGKWTWLRPETITAQGRMKGSGQTWRSLQEWKWNCWRAHPSYLWGAPVPFGGTHSEQVGSGVKPELV